MNDRLIVYLEMKEYIDFLTHWNEKEDLKLSDEDILDIANKMDSDREEIITLLGCNRSKRPITNNNTYCKIRRYMKGINVLYI